MYITILGHNFARTEDYRLQKVNPEKIVIQLIITQLSTKLLESLRYSKLYDHVHVPNT